MGVSSQRNSSNNFVKKLEKETREKEREESSFHSFAFASVGSDPEHKNIPVLLPFCCDHSCYDVQKNESENENEI